MVRKVVMPATISVRTVVSFSLSLKSRSSIRALPKLFSRRVCGHCPVQNQLPRLLPPPSYGGGGPPFSDEGAGGGKPQSAPADSRSEIFKIFVAAFPLRPLRGHLPRMTGEERTASASVC